MTHELRASFLRRGVFLDIYAEKEYTYVYEEGKLLRATECDIAIEGELITAKTVVHTLRYYYDGEGNLAQKVITPVTGEAQTIYYETDDDKTVVKYIMQTVETSCSNSKKQRVKWESKIKSNIKNSANISTNGKDKTA